MKTKIGLQMYELKIMQFKIDCMFWKKNQDGGHLINGVHKTFLL